VLLKRVFLAQEPDQLLHQGWSKDVIATQRAASKTRHQIRFPQSAQMLRKMRLGQRHQCVDVLHTTRLLAEDLQNRKSHRVGQDAEQPCPIFPKTRSHAAWTWFPLLTGRSFLRNAIQ